ncbi:YcgN family cysteine cluster protein [Aliidiomarina iranensis]|uniref:YcgN family cysteine cluster protein n=1 Tax=Aliidiomarina iranensis TaxID=1434071 RepID=A0A432VSL6_9GAMM|nr:YcgN family cysteine cluster protein [Aliidiomarina iranensis]RUO19315.1 YcgN family cysteine cluster protein [Aliidiomarina iranensis]
MAFWQEKTLAEMSESEWEALCDGCGKCCLHKLLEDRDDVADDAPMELGEDLHYTNVACQLLDTKAGGCSNYANRHQFVPDCVQLSLAALPTIHFMPPSCAYRRLHEGRGLPSWHPLLHGGSRAAMAAAGMAVTGYATQKDTECAPEDGLIVSWPLYDETS